MDHGSRVAVVGATGNVGTAVVRALGADASVDSVLGIARRVPSDWSPAKVSWTSADVVVAADLVSLFRGVDAVVHLAGRSSPPTTSRRCGA